MKKDRQAHGRMKASRGFGKPEGAGETRSGSFVSEKPLPSERKTLKGRKPQGRQASGISRELNRAKPSLADTVEGFEEEHKLARGSRSLYAVLDPTVAKTLEPSVYRKGHEGSGEANKAASAVGVIL
jgi:hypothetical protein